MIKNIYLDSDFDVEETSTLINRIMSKWSIHLIDITGRCWNVYGYNRSIYYKIHFNVDFADLETRIKLEDLRLNVIHHIESLRDDTAYTGQLITADLI